MIVLKKGLTLRILHDQTKARITSITYYTTSRSIIVSLRPPSVGVQNALNSKRVLCERSPTKLVTQLKIWMLQYLVIVNRVSCPLDDGRLVLGRGIGGEGELGLDVSLLPIRLQVEAFHYRHLAIAVVQVSIRPMVIKISNGE